MGVLGRGPRAAASGRGKGPGGQTRMSPASHSLVAPAASTLVYKSVQLLPLPAALGDFILLLKSIEGFVALRGKWTYLRTHSRKMERPRLEPRPPDPNADLLCTHSIRSSLVTPQLLEETMDTPLGVLIPLLRP